MIKNIIIVIIIVCFLFQYVAIIVGRQTMDDLDIFGTIATYLSGGLRFLQYVVDQGNFGVPITESMTLRFFFSSLNQIFGTNYNTVYRFGTLYVNRIPISNVGTVFSYYLSDAGFWGINYFTIIMAVITQIYYKRSILKQKNGEINMSLILYSYMYNGIINSFFSAKFYEHIIRKDFIEMIVFLYVLKWFLFDIKVTNKSKI